MKRPKSPYTLHALLEPEAENRCQKRGLNPEPFNRPETPEALSKPAAGFGDSISRLGHAGQGC